MLGLLNLVLIIAIIVLLLLSAILYYKTLSLYDEVVKKYRASSAHDMVIDNKFESLYGKIYS